MITRILEEIIGFELPCLACQKSGIIYEDKLVMT